MIRNFVLKLPSLKSNSEYGFSSLYRKRSFRSLSPIQKLQAVASAVTERSVSSSRAEGCHLRLDISEKPQARTFCFSKEYYAKNQLPPPNEIEWKENPSKCLEDEQQKDSISFGRQDSQIETLDQYELEAAKPRPSKSRSVIEAFKNTRRNSFFHLQPSQIKPYNSQENFYSPTLLKSPSSLKYPKKVKKPLSKEISEFDDVRSGSRGLRRYSTCNTSDTKPLRELSTTKSCIAKQGHSTKDNINCDGKQNNLKFNVKPSDFSKLAQSKYEQHWVKRIRQLEIAPPKYQPSSGLESSDIVEMKFSTSAMRKRRKEEENKQGFMQYKPSYSDLIKLKLKEKEFIKSNPELSTTANSDKLSVPCFWKTPKKSNKIMSSFQNLSDKRTITTKSKSNLLQNENSNSATPKEPIQKRNMSKNQKSSTPSKPDSKKPFNPKCEDICTPVVRILNKFKKKNFPLEPVTCEKEIVTRKVFLPSKVKLPVPPCLARPDYRDCKNIPKCPIRADQCLEIKPKKLPKLPPNDCDCVDSPSPTYAPKLEKLNLKFEDPPKVICHPPPCQTPRADDRNPQEFKPLKPYVAKDCLCMPQQPMLDVKLKRLPKCEPEEICRPPRVCPKIDPCAPRADECYKVLPKKLPRLQEPPCPCIDPPMPKIAPPIKRLNFKIPEPERICPREPPCSEVERADNHLKLKKKKLPKFVPGDCPCVDKPMVDWNLKRLVCEDELEECRVPDPCQSFLRADWGCWEYPDEVCLVMDKKCFPDNNPCEKPKEKPCRKKSVCETGAGPLNYRHVPRRKFGFTSSSSYPKLSQMKDENKVDKNEQQKNPEGNKRIKSSRKRPVNAPALHLLKLLNNCTDSDKTSDSLLFKPPKEHKVNYQSILKTIAMSAAQLEKKETNAIPASLKKTKSYILTVPSRAICTTENSQKDESDIRKEKELISKQKCKKVKPSIKSLICRKRCPRHQTCPSPKTEHKPACRYERVPVCCKKEEAPHSSYSDNLEETIRPYTNTPQWTCNKAQFGFHPVHNREYDPFKSKKKNNGKNYTTQSLVADLPITVPTTGRGTNKGLPTNKNIPGHMFCQQPSTGLLNHLIAPNSQLASQNRSFSTKVFQIRPVLVPKKAEPSKACGEKSRIVVSAPKITCQTEKTCKAEQRWCCRRDYSNPTVRKAPPFPAFSDCLDEEMEALLTECPLDKEKYLSMQPRFMNPPSKPMLQKAPPPVQGKIDLLKEQECLRNKLCIENEGVTQSCFEFGKPIKLMKTKKMVVEENRDCKVMNQLKKEGRWPPNTLKSSRPPHKNFSTAACNFNNLQVENYQRPCTRNYHVLTKSLKKTVFADDECDLKELTKKITPNNEVEKSPKLTKPKHNQGKIQTPNMHEKYNLAKKVRRYYSTYKTKKRLRLVNRFNRSASVLSRRMHFYRGRRYYKNERPKRNSLNEKERSRVKAHKNMCPKFTLNNCPVAVNRKKCHKLPVWQDCNKPFSPYPAYSECKEHTLVEPSCECNYDSESMPELQPRYSLFQNESPLAKEFPVQEKIDRTLGAEYYKCRHGILNEGKSIGCEAFGDYFNPNRKQKNKRAASIKSHPEEETDAYNQNNVVEFLVQEHKPSRSKIDEKESDSCEADGRKKMEEDICISECLKSIPCHLPEEEKYCLCKERCRNQNKTSEEELDINPPKAKCTAVPLEPVCKEVIPKTQTCSPKKSKNLTHLEMYWQKIVNYFKARPNCPQPGDYKKMALKQKAEKAANAVGLIVVDPKCLPPDLLESFKAAKQDCKVCPNQEPPKKCGIRSQSPEYKKTNFTPNFQPSRNYSKSMGCKNLEEINKMLEEAELKRRELQFKNNMSMEKKQYRNFFKGSQNDALKMSLDAALSKPVNFAELCYKNYSRTYFGYTNVLPSRENTLERAWRITVETHNNNNYYYPKGKHANFARVPNKSVKTAEELDKLKTENVLRELDNFLKCEDPDTKNNS